MQRRDHGLDNEEIANRLCGTLDAIRDLMASADPTTGFETRNLPYLMDMVCDEAHRLLDVDGGVRRPVPMND